jgi:Fur family ferric uptake transcriptional regulator
MEHDVDPEKILDRFHERLAELGLKSTRQRDVIVETFFRLDRHIAVEELLEEVRKEVPRIGYATVYRTMKLLEENRFADARRFGDGQTRYDPKVDANEQHDHLICIDCRRVIEFTDPVVEARIAQIAQELGTFELKRRTIELYVRCRETACEYREKRAE